MTALPRVGIVGTGYLGRLHARVLTEMPEVTVSGFVEPRDEVAREVTSSLGIRRFSDIASLASECDCVVVATPTIHHYDVAAALLRSGCDVMIEKPITSEPDAARSLITLARDLNRIIQVGHVERYNPAIVAAAGVTGRARYIEAQRLGVFAGRSLDIDVLLDLMIHDLNLVLSLTGREVIRIDAVGVPVLTDKVDIANVRLLLDDGAVANLTASRVSSERLRRIRFFGNDWYLSVDTKEQEVKGYRLVSREGDRSIEPLEVEVQKKEPLRAELESFVACVRDRSEPLVTAKDGLDALVLAVRVREAIEESMASSSSEEKRIG